jgi:hypothetical protein
MPKMKITKKNKAAFADLRGQLQPGYRADLQELCPGLTLKQIEYCLSGKSKDLERVKIVFKALQKLAKIAQRKNRNLQKLASAKS